MREVKEMTPVHIRLRKDADELRRALGGMGEVLEPQDADEPVLAASVQAAIFGWLVEMNARDELAAAGIKPRSSALLSGPPGCGKTTLAHHLAARLGVPMVNIGAEHILSSSFGGSENNVAKLFAGVEGFGKPCLLFIDEIDAIGGKRRDASNDGGGAVTAANSTLTVLLRKIEQFDGTLIAATNRAETLDPAMWRRFGMQIDVALPDDNARWAILKRYGEPFAFDGGLIDILTDLTDGAAPSLLRQIMEGVKRIIVLGGRGRVPASSLADAFGTVVAHTAPHPDYEPPLLWADTARSVAAIADASSRWQWPPERRQ